MASKSKGGGGFEKMGLPLNIIKGIKRKGYTQPTPIQRKTIPPILEGNDVMAMARTGSGKTAAFLIPIFRHLMSHSTLGIRAVILTPTRELALQTAKFIKDLSKFLDLKYVLVLGGDSMEEQFAAIHSCPDIVVTTPGRFLHLVVEMSLKLSSVTHVVFDEADRLFELGFAEQINEIIKRLPNQRQTLLFSATMPGLVAEFAKARLHNPLVIRLDVEHKLSENLELVNINVREEEKLALLLYLVDSLISAQLLTVIFVPTKHHVEFYREVLENSSVTCSYLYSSLDHTARKINAAKFYNRKTCVMIVTDIAARGIDIPILDVVININFPATPKLFVHRVGRVARAGRCGKAYSFIANQELPYLIDLTLFLGYSINVYDSNTIYNNNNNNKCMIGSVPPNTLMNECNKVSHLLNTCSTTDSLYKASLSANLKYSSSRSLPSGESVSRAKLLANELHSAPHPLFIRDLPQAELAHNDFLKQLRAFKPPCTIFEINPIKTRRKAVEVMRAKRLAHDDKIHHKRLHQESTINPDPFARARFDNDQFLDYYPKNSYSEKGLSVNSNNLSNDMILNIDGDETESLGRYVGNKRWDRKRKKFLQSGANQKVKKMKTESGSVIRASYKTNIYDNWLQKKKIVDKKNAKIDNALDTNTGNSNINPRKRKRLHKTNNNNRKPNAMKHTKKNTFDKSKMLNRKKYTKK